MFLNNLSSITNSFIWKTESNKKWIIELDDFDHNLQFIYNVDNDTILFYENNQEYLVINVEDKNKAANTLATIKNNIKKLVLHLKNNISQHDNEKEYIINLVKRTKEINIMETPADEKNTSYTINKGEKIVICLRSKFLNELHDINTVMYVVIHELAHVACPEYGHTPLFKKIFIFLLKESYKVNIYIPVDYRRKPQDYCGMTINEYLLSK
jgi:predicted metal-dependent hydrolase